MKNAIAIIGTNAYKYYLKPLPGVAKTAVLKAIMTHLIATTLALMIAGLAKLIKHINETT